MKAFLREQQPKEDTPLVVDNYPYGFRQKTLIRYWIDRTKRGERFVSQTLNPKTKEWNRAKYSTYDNIVIVGEEEGTGHIRCVALHAPYTSIEEAQAFYDEYHEVFDDWQLTEYRHIIAMLEVYKGVEFKIVTRKYRHKETGEITESIPVFEMDQYEEVNEDGELVDREREDKKQKELNRKINRAAVINAANTTGDFQAALDTFKRS